MSEDEMVRYAVDAWRALAFKWQRAGCNLSWSDRLIALEDALDSTFDCQ